MYDIHYNFINRTYKDQKTLLFTDIDLLTFQIKTQDIFDDMKLRETLFDIPIIQRIIDYIVRILRRLLDELNSKLAIAFVGFKSEMYSLKPKQKAQRNLQMLCLQTLFE